MKLDEKLVALRKERRLTQAKLAEALNVSRQAISRWELGESMPSTENLKYLSNLYNVPLDYLLNDAEQELIRKEPEKAKAKKKKLAVKPTVPGGSQYVECWGVDTTGRYGGKTYDVFEIYAAGLKYGGLGNPLGYQKEAVTLLTDSAWDNSTFAKDFYTDAKFVIGAFSIPFAVVDYLALSKMPDFFDTGSTQQLLLGYNALQTYCFQYVAEKGINWYDLMLTTEQVDFSETLTAISTGGPGKTRRSSKDRENMMIESSHYADANYAAQLLATNALRKEYHTGNIKYYVNGTMKHRVNFNSFSELYTIPGL